jgi:hypothetical protein
MSAIDKIKSIQTILGVIADGKFGPKSRAALDDLIAEAAELAMPPPSRSVHTVLASSFADPADVAAFRKCKAQGKSDQECFKVGDNGVGKWGDDTTGPVPMCALPPEDWKPFGSAARGKKVIVVCEGKTVVCELRDTMPAKANIKNGAGIDLNEAAWKALGHKPPQLRNATWQWA